MSHGFKCFELDTLPLILESRKGECKKTFTLFCRVRRGDQKDYHHNTKLKGSTHKTELGILIEGCFQTLP